MSSVIASSVIVESTTVAMESVSGVPVAIGVEVSTRVIIVGVIKAVISTISRAELSVLLYELLFKGLKSLIEVIEFFVI